MRARTAFGDVWEGFLAGSSDGTKQVLWVFYVFVPNFLRELCHCEIQQPFSHSSGKVNTQAALVCGSYGKTLSRGASAEGNSSDMRVGSFRPKAPRSLPVYPFWNQHNIALEQ